MFISVEDEDKLEIVKDYKPRELDIILHFLECGMFYDELGRPYSRNAWAYLSRGLKEESNSHLRRNKRRRK